MFERALADLEAALGPAHPDVAHAAIDLGVLRLEQVITRSEGMLSERPARIRPRLHVGGSWSVVPQNSMSDWLAMQPH